MTLRLPNQKEKVIITAKELGTREGQDKVEKILKEGGTVYITTRARKLFRITLAEL